jgi:hypothetical protein
MTTASSGRVTAVDAGIDMMGALSIHDPAEAGSSRLTYLTPLQNSLVYELTTRRKRIANAQNQVDFWLDFDQKGQVDAGEKDKFGEDVVDQEFLDDLIAQRKARIAELKQMDALKQAIVHSADAAHTINASMTAVAPGDYAEGTTLCVHANRKPDQQPLRSLVARRDELALDFLKLDDRIKQLRKDRQGVAEQIVSVRSQTSALVREIEQHKGTLEERREQHTKRLSMPGNRKENDAQQRITVLREAIQASRSKRMIIKGVLRGVLLESGIDWSADPETTQLMLSLADEDQEMSEEQLTTDDEVSTDDDSATSL